LANHKSAAKRARQALKRQERNRTVRSETRSRVKAVRAAIETGDRESATQLLRVAERSLRKAASKGIVKKTTASRNVSRLSKAVAALS
jgi:small subunit ribosomal protein S20